MEESVLLKLCSKAKIDRDKGYQDLEEYIGRADDASVHLFQSRLVDMLLQGSSEWETRHGALMGSKAIILARMTPQELISSLLEKAFELADDSEFRVRIAAGEVIGSLCGMYGSDIYRDCRENVLQSIFVNLERDPLTDSAMGEQEETDKLIEKLSSSPSGERRYSADAAQIFHDTAGWKSLETWMKCLQSIIEGLGHNFNPFVDQALLDLIFRALTHTNRFVRETGYYVCASLVACGCVRDGSGTALLDEENAILKYGHQFSEHLCKGLADNWSQVRLASSVATRTFLQSLPSDEARHQFFPTLLPRMCLNRYYMAEGVRIYSQDTWKQVTGTQGRLLVEKYISNVVDYYIEATDADNHAVREAACACIAELGAKVSKEVVHSLIPRMLQALLICFNDDSWPVRDAACVACGNFILCFPEESRSSLPDLYPLFFNNLQDNILSVRQGAALALANVVKAYGDECFSEIIAKVKEGLAGVERQPENTEKYSSLDKGPATYGVVKKLRDNDMTLHTDKQMYSCGSLAPKMGRGKREGGCMDHKFRKEPEPWELADGCIQLVSDLCQLQKFAAKVAELLPLVAKAASYDHYTHHANMKETLCHRIPHMATGLGKRYFKAYLEIFFDAIFASLDSENSLTSAAASNCLAELANFLGPSILRGRIEQYNPR
ncbi:uncharacterized protein LOC127870865 isoform X3 [Dreissena polymorpha]|nr:uncharacterized protein LOC127870865 isoform X2 [Dreissena polymorpha]XP_052269390.1 uncharacterized protein LOC127870865 isoform X3 [Dreissena polymorpha]